MGLFRLLRVTAAPLLAGTLAAIAAGCGSSTSQSVTSPSSDSRCALTVNYDNRPIDASGGSGALSIGVNRECAWTARTESDWIALGATASGQGNGNLTFSVAGNALVAARRGAIVVNDRRVEVSQSGAPCVFSLSTTSRTVDADGDRYSVAVSAQTGCSWTVSSPAPWIEATPLSGSGAGSVTITVARNDGASRSGALVIAGLTHTVFQTAAPPTEPPPTTPPAGCTFELSAGTQAVGADGGPAAVTVLAPPGCAWTAASQVDWVTITSGPAGTGTADVTFIASPNRSSTPRIGSIVAAGKTLTITQVGETPLPPTPPPPPPACTFTIAPSSIAQDSAGGAVTVSVSASAPTCPWTAAPGAAWITVSSLGGSGSGDLRVTIAANATTTVRTAAITVAGRSIAVSQAGAPETPPPPPPPPPPSCSFTVGPASQTAPAVGGTGQVTVTASAATCAWTATSNAPWLTIASGAAGAGSGAVAFAVAPNPNTAARTATISAAGQAVTVTQEAAPPTTPSCTFALSRTELTVAAIDLTETVRVETTAGCGWTAQSQVPWITVTSGASGTGAGDVRITVALNVGLARRTGTVVIAGQTVTVTQAGLLGASQP